MTSPLRALAYPIFRALLLASLVSSLGAFVQDVGEAWLMVALGGTPLQIALVSTTTWAPAILITLPAGALADQLDRRAILLVAQAWLALTALALSLACSAGRVTPLGLLTATTALGVGAALNGPAWATLVPDLVPRRQLADAVVVQSLTWNIARAIGPALGGLVIARMGVASAFAVNAASFLGVIGVLYRVGPQPPRGSRTPIVRSIVRGLRYVRATRDLRVVSITTACYGATATPVLALLPVLVVHELALGSESFGVLLGCFGGGALVGALALPYARRTAPERMIPACMAVSGAAIVAVAAAPSFAVACIALAPAGAMWLMVLSTQNAIVQALSAGELRGRVKSVDNLLFLGATSIGTTLAGVIANTYGARPVLVASGIATMGVAFVARHVRLPDLKVTSIPPAAPPGFVSMIPPASPPPDFE